jgi:hypothetical protein
MLNTSTVDLCSSLTKRYFLCVLSDDRVCIPCFMSYANFELGGEDSGPFRDLRALLGIEESAVQKEAGRREL